MNKEKDTIGQIIDAIFWAGEVREMCWNPLAKDVAIQPFIPSFEKDRLEGELRKEIARLINEEKEIAK